MKSKKYQTVRCPDPACLYQFDVAVEKLGRNIRCPGCERIITARPLEAWRAMERQQERMLASAGESSGDRIPLVGVVDDVRSLLNVGSIFRTSDGAGVRELVLCGITGVPDPPKTHIQKTALGAERAVPWRYHAYIVNALNHLKDDGYRIIGLEEGVDAVPVFQWIDDTLPAVESPIALVVGNEVAGISAEARPVCDEFISLPMFGVKQSLNVSVAYGIAVYAIGNGLRAKKSST